MLCFTLWQALNPQPKIANLHHASQQPAAKLIISARCGPVVYLGALADQGKAPVLPGSPDQDAYPHRPDEAGVLIPGDGYGCAEGCCSAISINLGVQVPVIVTIHCPDDTVRVDSARTMEGPL